MAWICPQSGCRRPLRLRVKHELDAQGHFDVFSFFLSKCFFIKKNPAKKKIDRNFVLRTYGTFLHSKGLANTQPPHVGHKKLVCLPLGYSLSNLNWHFPKLFPMLKAHVNLHILDFSHISACFASLLHAVFMAHILFLQILVCCRPFSTMRVPFSTRSK